MKTTTSSNNGAGGNRGKWHEGKAFWDANCNGVSGVGPIKAFDASCFRSKIAGYVNNFEPVKYMEEVRRVKLTTLTNSPSPVKMTLDDSRLPRSSKDPYRVGLFGVRVRRCFYGNKF